MPRLDRASLLAGVDRLTRRDRRLHALVMRFGPPPLWGRPTGFATLLRIILEQQVSLASAKALYTRLSASVPEVAPATVLRLGVTGLQALGFTRQKASYCHGLAAHVSDGRLPLRRLGRMPDDDALERLMQVPGIGPWTAGIYLLMALRRPDIWPPGDLALHKAMAPFERGVTPSTARAEEIASGWRPLRAVAARILWHSYLSARTALVA
ncbi:MAG: DNA-3-methyladenine glycosylase [Gemmatimonadales bacterium]